MHHFDNHIEGGFEVVGGIDDISVDSIFGGMHNDRESDSDESDSDASDSDESDSDESSSDESSSDESSSDESSSDESSHNSKPSCNCDSNCDNDCKCKCGCGDKKKSKVVGSGDANMVSGMNIDLHSCTTPNSLIGSISLPIASIEPQSKAIGSGYQGLTAHDVSSLIQNYR